MKKSFLLVIILSAYAFLYIATTKPVHCEGDCERTLNTYIALNAGRDYVYNVSRCSPQVTDTLCILVKDTTGINWDLFADTACMVATQNGLLQQKIFVLKNATHDTLARKSCP